MRHWIVQGTRKLLNFEKRLQTSALTAVPLKQQPCIKSRLLWLFNAAGSVEQPRAACDS